MEGLGLCWLILFAIWHKNVQVYSDKPHILVCHMQSGNMFVIEQI